jgi:hypothetical protein
MRQKSFFMVCLVWRPGKMLPGAVMVAPCLYDQGMKLDGLSVMEARPKSV